MNHYRKTLRIRSALFAAAMLLAAALGVYSVFFVPETMKENPVFGFQCGALTAMGLFSLLPLLRFQRALRDEQALQLLYNQEHDERLKAIRGKAGMPLVGITSGLMLVAGIICGYFNAAIFYALFAAAAAQMLLVIAVKLIAKART